MDQNNLGIACGHAGDSQGWHRVGLAFFASVALHTLVFGWRPDDRPAGRLPLPAYPAPLLATLVRTMPESLRPPIPLAEPKIPVSVGTKVGADDTPLQQKARFAVTPDFSLAEAVPLTRAARLRLRIHVTPQGGVGRIEIIESLLVPPDFLAAISEILGSARYMPGVAGGQPVASNFELAIDAQPPASDTPQSPLGSAKVTPSE